MCCLPHFSFRAHMPPEPLSFDYFLTSIRSLQRHMPSYTEIFIRPPCRCHPASRRCLSLAIIRIFSVLAEIVLILQFLGRRLDSCIDCLCAVSHLRHLFQNDCIMHCIMAVLPPGKRSVILAKSSGNRRRILLHPFKLVDNKNARVLLVCLRNLLLGQAAQARDFSIIIVGMGSSVTGNAPPRLCPACRVGRMGMYDAANLSKRLDRKSVV